MAALFTGFGGIDPEGAGSAGAAGDASLVARGEERVCHDCLDAAGVGAAAPPAGRRGAGSSRVIPRTARQAELEAQREAERLQRDVEALLDPEHSREFNRFDAFGADDGAATAADGAAAAGLRASGCGCCGGALRWRRPAFTASERHGQRAMRNEIGRAHV